MSRLFGEAIQTAIIVPDTEKAMQGWLEAGIGPFFVAEEHRMPARFRGGETEEVVFRAAFACSGDMQYELIQPLDDTPSAFREYLNRHPEGGFHHIAYLCDDIDDKLAEVNADGPLFEVVQEFVFPDGHVHEVYLEPVRNVTGQIAVQLISRKNEPGVQFFEQMKVAAAEWDGSRPVRSVIEMYLDA